MWRSSARAFRGSYGKDQGFRHVRGEGRRAGSAPVFAIANVREIFEAGQHIETADGTAYVTDEIKAAADAYLDSMVPEFYRRVPQLNI